jgi:hypothetical protein
VVVFDVRSPPHLVSLGLTVQYAESVAKCLADPNKQKCQHRPPNHRLPPADLTLGIFYLPPESMTRTVYIRISGVRLNGDQQELPSITEPNESPQLRSDIAQRSDPHAPLPKRVQIFAVPHFQYHQQKVVWRPRLLCPPNPVQSLYPKRLPEMDRNYAVKLITEVDLTSDVKEHQVRSSMR